MTHPAEVRAEVVAAVLAGMTVMDAARRFGLSKQTISRWVIEAENGTTGTRKTHPPLEQLIGDYLVIGFRAMISQAQVFSDPDYCRSQDADKLAIAHGVLGDKLAGVAATAQALGLLGVPLEDSPGQARLGAAAAPAAEP